MGIVRSARAGNAFTVPVNDSGFTSSQSGTPRLGTRRREAEPVHDVVEPPLEELEECLTRHATRAIRHLEVPPKLALEHAVDATELLLLAELDRVLRELGARLTVLAGRVVAPLDSALVRVAALAFQEELQA